MGLQDQYLGCRMEYPIYSVVYRVLFDFVFSDQSTEQKYYEKGLYLN